MNIAIDARELEGKPTGAGRFLLEILKQWPEEIFVRHKITLFFKDEIPDLDFIGASRAEKILFRPSFLARHDLLWEQILLPFYLFKCKADIFWGSNGACSLISLRDTKKIVSVYDLTFLMDKAWFGARERAVRRFRFWAGAFAADVFMTISESTAADLTRAAKKKNIQVVGPGMEHRRLQNEAPGHRPPGNILFAGTLLNRRPVENVIRAIGILAEKHPDILLTVAGENRTQPKRNFQRLIDDLGLSSRVRLCGYVSEEALSKLYRENAIFIYPSLYEGFGIPVIEAQSYGLPVVTLKNSSLAEVGKDSVLYAASEKEEDLASAIGLLLSDEALRLQLKEKGLKNAGRFSWSASAKSVLTLLEKW